MFNEVLLEGQLMWNTPLLVCLIGIAVLYALLVYRLTDIKIYYKQPLFFFLSLGLLYLTIGSPLTTISHLSFSLHMIQMSILYFIVPPIFLLGIPNNVFQKIWKIPMVKGISKRFLPPRFALIIFAVLFLMYHLPIFLNLFSQNSFVHNAYIVLLLILSFSMWWPIAAPDPKQRFCKGQKKRYAFLNGVFLMPACFLFILGAFMDGMNNPFLTQLTSHLCTPSHSISLDILPPPFNTKYDQVMSGIFMLGMHKFALMLTFRLRNKVLDAREEKICWCGPTSLFYKVKV
ncbi:cytochrome c oxidase assembly protein [Alkalihalobacillus sp. BA299]|uniref:cytochrome c oxidase assembly protein n=1 Tax=Alkalihalobacillus sp. BA299 TaxID=2815938 RepID=UPI0027DE979A|nr:cytochrome c oxidase assembly protein [Alkalihalobacillus sp. BA299]